MKPLKILLSAILMGMILFLSFGCGNSEEEKDPLELVFIPLDSRPVNTDLPKSLAALSGNPFFMPEEGLDQYLEPSDSAALLSWLKETISEEKEQHLIINMNELFFGGLIHSRNPETYEEGFSHFKEEKAYLSGLNMKKTYLFILPRTIPSSTHPVLSKYQKELVSYSENLHKAHLEGKAFCLDMDQKTAEIYDLYASLFSKAEDFSKELLSLADENTEVIIGIDDSNEFGLNVEIFEELKKEYGNSSNSYFLHGADELDLLAIAKTLHPGEVSMSLQWMSEEDQDQLFPYEAISLKDNFEEKLDYINSHGAVIKEPDHILFIHSDSLEEEKQKSFFDQAKELKKEGKLTGLIECQKTNGADAAFMASLDLNRLYDCFDGFAGWNTAGNSLGTVMAQLISMNQHSSKELKSIQEIRILDDYVYETLVKPDFIQWQKDQGHGTGDWNDEEFWKAANEKIRELMNEKIKELDLSVSKYRYEFPWPRNFEIHIY